MPAVPVDGSYWVVPGVLLAGRHPNLAGLGEARSAAGRLLEAGIGCFVDLTQSEEYGLSDYGPLVQGRTPADGRPWLVLHHPIEDMSLPSAQAMVQILAAIDAALAAGHMVYVHCHAGLGRTGTVIGCWLARRLGSGQAALEELARLRRVAGLAGSQSPETDEQRAFVINWLQVDPLNDQA